MQKILHFSLQALCNILAREEAGSDRTELRCQSDEQLGLRNPDALTIKKSSREIESFFLHVAKFGIRTPNKF